MKRFTQFRRNIESYLENLRYYSIHVHQEENKDNTYIKIVYFKDFLIGEDDHTIGYSIAFSVKNSMSYNEIIDFTKKILK